ncbi:peptidase S8 and S53 subtilisin kexin sedolisin [Desulfofarcimen acetoxidans DSM 771]|uniref:Peptidase S8 and S53 subtilisin kexin sedolisin n=1 Tax=Desulfofarcimen acetoxidans (strain ATCC 49208 / DSM 771 / KCTC 5769 / VKM B-1644 / 5575) TaxID=485916 RepID=C8VXM0_DESAS|nr:S8 family serine peptidase [Desulfofarcimen acetoxidans]ACV62676.1 peptidase S8 and S53 subtilisin kexin sedolisin [Desulfofarcimen acetoxidans DSM 771]
MKYLLLILVIISPIWVTGFAIANERTSYYSDEKEILVKYKDEVIETWGERLLEPKNGSFFSQDNKPVAEDFLPEIGVVKYTIPTSLSMEAAIKAFKNDERVQLVATNDTRLLDPYMVKSYYESCNESVYDGVYQNPSYKEQWALQQFDIPKIREEIDDDKIKQVTVAILDTGVDLQHEDLKDALVNGYNFVSNNEDPTDDVGHGTHVAGIVGAINNDKGIIGVASGVKIMPVKVLNSQSTGDVMTEIKGIVWAVDNGANVINLSLGGERFKCGVDAFNPVEYAAVQYAISKGVVVVAAAGNYSEIVSYPAAYPDVIAVTSVDQLGDISIFSNLGTEVSIAAPGEDIYSTMPENTYQYATGTSVAAPFVSGITALILAKNKLLTPYEVKQLIEAGADDKGNPGKDDQYGYGITNPQRSIGLLVVKIKSSESNLFYQGRSLQFSLTMEDIEQNVQSSVCSGVYQDVYSFVIDFNKSYGKYYYGDYHLEKGSVVSIVYGKGEQAVLLEKPGFYETRTRSVNQEYAGNRYKFSLFPEAPIANIESGYYSLPIDLVLTTSTVPGSIYYTTDGESPLKEGKLRSDAKHYTEPIKITTDTNIKAITVSERFTSTTASYWYKQFFTDLSIEIEEEDQIIKTENYLLEVNKQNNSSIYRLILKDLIENKNDQYFVIDLALTNTGSSHDKLILSKETLQKLAELEKDVKIKYLAAEILLSHEQIVKMKQTSINEVELEFISLIRETAKTHVSLFQEQNNKSSINLASNVAKTDLKYFKDGEQVYPDELNDIKIKLTISMTTEETQESQWYDFRKMGVFQLIDEMYYEYLGGELDLSSQCFTIEIKPEKQILFVAENSQSFEDIQDHWAQKCIEVLASRQIVQNINEEEFFPDDAISRAEFVIMLVKELDRGKRQIYTEYQGYFKDVSEEEWYSPYIERAKEIGLISGTKADLFKPEERLTREEAFTILMRIYEMTKKENGLTLGNWRIVSLLNEERVAQRQTASVDIQEVSEWAKPEIIKGLEMGIIYGYPDGTIRPKHTLTKAEASVILLRLFEKCSDNSKAH